MFKGLSKNNLTSIVSANLTNVNFSMFFLPCFFSIAIILFLYYMDVSSVEKYTSIQKDWFYYINSKQQPFPKLIYNITQLGDALIFLSLISILIIYAPKFWESIIAGSIVSAIFSRVLKDMFNVPRPAEIFDNNTFAIIGRKLVGFSSLPSGHSITTFTILTLIMFAFMPKKLSSKTFWCIILVGIGFVIISTRVIVGAHFPLDVIIGGTFGYFSALIGILIIKKYKIFTWIGNKVNYPFFILAFFVCGIVLAIKIQKENLLIYYVSLLSTIISLSKMIYDYFKK